MTGPHLILYTAWRDKRGGVEVDEPQPCWSQLVARRRFKEQEERKGDEGAVCWFARIEFPDGDFGWLKDNRAGRNGNGHHEPLD